jgi:hypothetical protein
MVPRHLCPVPNAKVSMNCKHKFEILDALTMKIEEIELLYWITCKLEIEVKKRRK